MKQVILSLILMLYFLNSFGQNDSQTVMSKLGANPVYIINETKVSKESLYKYSSDSIASVEVLLDTNAIKLYGDSAKDGAVIIETRSFARRKFISFFRQESTSFDSLYSSIGNDNSFQYVINDKIQTGNYEGNLTAISKALFLEIEILTKEQLMLKYKIKNKNFGIVVHAKRPENLFNVDQKF